MLYLILKAALSGVIVMAVSEIARRNPTFGALVVSLPLVSLLGILWLWRDTHDVVRIASHAEATFWYVLPSMPMFLALPYMLRHAVNFWLAMLGACTLTILLYGITVLVAARFGVKL